MGSAENIRVILRVRPLNNTEIARGEKCCIKFLDDNQTVNLDKKNFTFDAVLPLATKQKEAYEVIGKPIVDSVLDGYNGTIFAYGQTSSGKTHTMEGDMGDVEQKGIIPRIVDDIFDRISSKQGDYQFFIKVQYMEIYMERIKDCLNPSKDNLLIGETKSKTPFVKGITERCVGSREEVYETLASGRLNRSVGATHMNAVSSRSHSLVIMIIQSEDLTTHRKREGIAYLVDLAGSEKVAKTGAAGQTLDEAKQINKSLSTLGNVISALVENHSHIPYRNSKLTRILQNSLGGNSKTTLVICCSPAEYNLEETKSTVYFGQRAKEIKNNFVVNEELTVEEYKSLFNKLKDNYNGLYNEIKCWRSGKKVAEKDWFKINEPDLQSCSTMESVEIPNEPNEPSEPTKPNKKEEGEEIICIKSEKRKRKKSISSIKKDSVNVKIQKIDYQDVCDGKVIIDLDILELMYKELDVKDEEINVKTEELAKLEESGQKLFSDFHKLTFYSHSIEEQLVKYKSNLKLSQKEVNALLDALQDLVQKNDKNSDYIQLLNQEIIEKVEKITKLEGEIRNKEKLLKKSQLQNEDLRKHVMNCLNDLIAEFMETGSMLNPDFAKPNVTDELTIDGQLIGVRLLMSNFKNLAQTMKNLEKENLDQITMKDKSIDEMHKNLISLGMKFQATKTNLDATRKSYEELLQDKFNADMKIVALRGEKINQRKSLVNNLQPTSPTTPTTSAPTTPATAPTTTTTTPSTTATTTTATTTTLITKGKRTNESITKQIDNSITEDFQADYKKLLIEIKKLKTEIAKLNGKLELEKGKREELLQNIEDLKGEIEKKNKRITMMELQNLAKDKVRRLDDEVTKEIMSIKCVGKVFLADIKTRGRKFSMKDKNSESSLSSLSYSRNQDLSTNAFTSISNEKVSFLEKKLDTITLNHVNLIRNLSELQMKLPKLESQLKGALQRIEQLENHISDVKDAAARERRRYQVEMELLRDNASNYARNKSTYNIVKPIIAGRPLSTYMYFHPS